MAVPVPPIGIGCDRGTTLDARLTADGAALGVSHERIAPVPIGVFVSHGQKLRARRFPEGDPQRIEGLA